MIFNWNEKENQIQYLQTLHLSIDPLDLAYDISGNLWVSNYVKEEQPDESLITVFRKNDDWVCNFLRIIKFINFKREFN